MEMLPAPALTRTLRGAGGPPVYSSPRATGISQSGTRRGRALTARREAIRVQRQPAPRCALTTDGVVILGHVNAPPVAAAIARLIASPALARVRAEAVRVGGPAVGLFQRLIDGADGQAVPSAGDGARSMLSLGPAAAPPAAATARKRKRPADGAAAAAAHEADKAAVSTLVDDVAAAISSHLGLEAGFSGAVDASLLISAPRGGQQDAHVDLENVGSAKIRRPAQSAVGPPLSVFIALEDDSSLQVAVGSHVRVWTIAQPSAQAAVGKARETVALTRLAIPKGSAAVFRQDLVHAGDRNVLACHHVRLHFYIDRSGFKRRTGDDLRTRALQSISRLFRATHPE